MCPLIIFSLALLEGYVAYQKIATVKRRIVIAHIFPLENICNLNLLQNNHLTGWEFMSCHDQPQVNLLLM